MNINTEVILLAGQLVIAAGTIKVILENKGLRNNVEKLEKELRLSAYDKVLSQELLERVIYKVEFLKTELKNTKQDTLGAIKNTREVIINNANENNHVQVNLIENVAEVQENQLKVAFSSIATKENVREGIHEEVIKLACTPKRIKRQWRKNNVSKRAKSNIRGI